MAWCALGAAAAPVEVVLEPVRAMVVGAPVEGVLAEVKVEEGDTVAAGDLLAAFQREEEELLVARAREVLRKREFDFAGVEQLFRDNMTSEVEKLEREIELNVARLELAQAEERRDRRLVRAVQAGVITVRHRVAGEYVERGAPLYDLVDARQLDARFYVDPAAGLTLRVGDTVRVRVPLLERSVEGRLVFVDPQVDPSSGLMRVRARIANEEGEVRPGLRGWVVLGTEEPARWP